MKKTASGFTIVELLIVIVVIGILAAVTIVSYRGIQTRAENTKTLNAVITYVKGLKLYASDKGNFPIQAGYPCLGVASESCGATSTVCWGIAGIAGSASFVSDLSPAYISTMPALSTQATKCDASGALAKGGFYYSADGITAWVYYFLRGDADCGRPGGLVPTKVQAQDTTYCYGSMIQ